MFEWFAELRAVSDCDVFVQGRDVFLDNRVGLAMSGVGVAVVKQAVAQTVILGCVSFSLFRAWRCSGHINVQSFYSSHSKHLGYTLAQLHELAKTPQGILVNAPWAALSTETAK